MKRGLVILLLICLPALAHAGSPGMDGFSAVRQCVMQNDIRYCHSIMTQGSYDIFDRFVSYKLMPCLPTDFTYDSETDENGMLVVKAVMPAGGGQHYVMRLVFARTPNGALLDVPASFRRGLGEKWEDKIQMSEQLYIMMKQNMGDKLTCDMLSGLIKPH